MIPIACFVSNNAETTPSTGATALPTAGIIAAPFPIISSEKVASSTCFSETALPSIGAHTTDSTVISLLFSMLSSKVLSSLTSSTISSSSFLGSSKPNIHVPTKAIATDIPAVINAFLILLPPSGAINCTIASADGVANT